ncbi:MAG: NUDIX domain-containing protein [Pseudomonadota bacterium]|nr:NUDIX domain-containing protein [Pseudomonadota bacterium]
MTKSQDVFFKAVAARQIPRIRLAGIVINENSVLVQQPADDPSSYYAFIGGEYEVGDTFESRLRKEFDEETNAQIVDSKYLFCVENHFHYSGDLIQQVEHYFAVTLNRSDIVSREDHLTQHWLPLDEISTFELRPFVVRDALADGSYLNSRYMVQSPA